MSTTDHREPFTISWWGIALQLLVAITLLGLSVYLWRLQ
jgi:hypothetical protein